MRRLAAPLAVALTACAAPDAAPPPTPARIEATPPSAPLPTAAQADVQACGRDGLVAFDACDRGVLGRLATWTPDHGLPPITPAQVDAACGPIAALYLRCEPLEGTHREVLLANEALARAGEDARVLALRLRDAAHVSGPLRSAIDHLRRSIPEGRAGLARAAEATALGDLRPIAPGPIDVRRLAGDLRRILENDHNDLGGLPGVFDNYAFQQCCTAEFVRAMLLRHFGAWADAYVRAAQASQAGLQPMDDDAARLRDLWGDYLVAARAHVDAFRGASAAFLAGPVDRRDADAHKAAVDAAHARWEDARRAALAALPQ